MEEKDNLILDENLITDRELRDKLSNRIEVLDKVKELVTLSETDFVTIQQVADYYGVTDKSIKNLVSSNKEEIENDGSTVLKRDYFEKEVNFPFKNNHGSVTYSLPSGQELTVSNRGLRVFSKRAVLRIGMLLTKSEVARRLRTALLDVVTGEVPVTTTVQDALTDMIDNQKKNLMGVVSSLVSGDTESAIRGMSDLCVSDQKHMRRMYDEIAEKNEIIEDQKNIIEDQEKIINITKEKSDAYDDLCESEFAHETKDACKVIGFGRTTFRNMLKRDKYLMEDGTPYQKYINMGLFELRLKRYPRQHYTYHMTYVTDKGITYFKKLYSGKAVNA